PVAAAAHGGDAGAEAERGSAAEAGRGAGAVGNGGGVPARARSGARENEVVGSGVGGDRGVVGVLGGDRQVDRGAGGRRRRAAGDVELDRFADGDGGGFATARRRPAVPGGDDTVGVFADRDRGIGASSDRGWRFGRRAVAGGFAAVASDVVGDGSRAR